MKAHDPSSDPDFDPFRPNRILWKRLLFLGGGGCLLVLIVFLLLWHAFFVYVKPGHHLVVISKEGKDLPSGQVLAEPGEKGIQREVLGEGWHFILPIVYETKVEENTMIPPGKVGIVTAKGGKPLPPGRILAEAKEGEQGIQRQVLPPGAYRLNRHGYEVAKVDAVEIKPGFVGVQQRLLGKEGRGRFADRPDEKGILRQVLQPGLYYINNKELEVRGVEVGITQTSFRYDPKHHDTSISFTSKGGFKISLDCTVEWEVLPENMPTLVSEFGDRKGVEQRVINPQAKAIGRDKGIDYGVQDFLEGSKREKFQEDFTNELVRVCKEKKVVVHSAFIRNIVIPDAYLKPIRDKQIAAETELTNKAKELTATSEEAVVGEQQTIEQRKAMVQADTARLVTVIDRETSNIQTKTHAEIDKMKADYEAKIAALDAERTKVLGEAEAEVRKLKDTAQSSLYELKMKVFDNDGDAFLRYSLAQQLNPKMVLRLFHSGPGTFWTNMEGKGMNLMVPAGQAAPAKAK